MKIFFTALILTNLFFRPLAAVQDEARPEDARQEEAASLSDRLATSLFFRGELADKILEAGMAERFVDLKGIETYSGARSALLTWIRKNPGKAAEVYLNMKGAGGKIHDSIETRKMNWEFNPAFIASVKALNSAAGNSSVSRETLELAARRLYEGPQADTEGPEVRIGGASGGSDLFSVKYADYKLNKAGLERAVREAGAWLGSVRSEGLKIEIKGPYSAAFSLYKDFVVAAASLKGRAVVTEQESRGLEALRLRLRSAMSALSLRARISALKAAVISLDQAKEEPGAGELRQAVFGLKAALEALAARIEAGGAALGELGRLVNSAENDFAALYLRYSVYDGLLSLKRKASAPGFSCLYDYAAYSYLASFFPATPYPAARKLLGGSAAGLDTALFKAGSGDLPGALAGLDAGKIESAAGTVRSSSEFNRGAQFFLGGFLLRPVEYKITVRKSRAFFYPVFTIAEVAVKKRHPAGGRPGAAPEN
ncbi:MAG: hypothetical protein COX65_03455 [Elusimicrobia bacterium CG_4_10_14_0_2_um_filter_56_8]|nr:MAG: hypothetical protein AUJ51_00880 [Elusimicrobia bacterium CG1_02_56_21]PJA16006.1 MAG: hypothetical protein COX65_03455 [Elusimicrobia bacterium CG_4_10_14_0_2_um_filter_56_8]